MSIPRVLVVDDEVGNRMVVRRVLEAEGYLVDEATDGENAIEAVLRAAPDLVLLDLEMPKADGYSALRVLKGDPKTRLIPVVMLTSHDQLAEKVRALEFGVDDYLLKPFNLPELTARVKSLVALKRFTDDLEHAERIMGAMAQCIEGRDRYTGNHCRRLAAYATRVGKAFGLAQDNLKVLYLGGIFHDLGKVAISDAILNKPGRLTSEEMELMKTHPAACSEILVGMRTMEGVHPLIRNHHEKLDGSGYPDRLSGEGIPLLVRIMSVVDVFDALHTKRSYKDSLPLDRCLAILREEVVKGWWDRDVVEALAAVLGSGGVERSA